MPIIFLHIQLVGSLCVDTDHVSISPPARERIVLKMLKDESKTPMVTNSEIHVLRYDKVVKALSQKPTASLEDISQRTGVALGTIRKIWEGTITRPPTVVLDRLKTPRRCPECRSLCTAWPCIQCEMKRRPPTGDQPGVNFIYRHGPH